jgi:hypothetical protein
MLTLADVPGYLLGRALVSPRSIVDGDLVVHELSSRNRVFSAHCRDARSHLLKQGDRRAEAVGYEAEVYLALAEEPRLRGHLPRFHGYDAAERVLAIEFLPDAIDLASYHARQRKPSVRVAEAVGRLLASLHGTPLTRWNGLTPPRPHLSFPRPHRPTMEFYATATAAMLDLVRIVQATPGFGDHLDELRAGWSSTAPIHHDVRWSNLMLATTPGSRPRLTLVDWEMAGPGDPRWDIGSALANYLTLWISSIPTSATADPVRSSRLARRPLGDIQQAIRACWRGYLAGMGLSGGAATRMLATVVPFTAARLVHTALESAQASAQPTSDQVLHLQVAHNVLERPREAAVHLLGLGADGTA